MTPKYICLPNSPESVYFNRSVMIVNLRRAEGHGKIRFYGNCTLGSRTKMAMPHAETKVR